MIKEDKLGLQGCRVLGANPEEGAQFFQRGSAPVALHVGAEHGNTLAEL